MDTLLPAFLAALLAEVGDKTQWLVLLLGARFGKRPAVLGGIALAAIINAALAGFGGALIAGLITPEARALLLAIALVSAGVGAWLPIKAPEPVDGWRLGAFFSSFGAFFLLELGDKTQFLTAAIAARAGSAAMATAGAAAGVILASAATLALGAALPRVVLRRGAGTVFLLVGFAVAVSALRLI